MHRPGMARQPPVVPHGLTVLAVILIVVWVASIFIPSGVYDTTLRPPADPRTYRELASCDSRGGGALRRNRCAAVLALWDATPNGPMACRTRRPVGQWEDGFLYGAPRSSVRPGVAIHHDGDEGGAIQTGIGRLAMRFKSSGTALIVVLMLIFAGVGRRTDVGGNLGSSPDGAAGAGLGYDLNVAVGSHLPRGPGRRPGLHGTTRSPSASPRTRPSSAWAPDPVWPSCCG